MDIDDAYANVAHIPGGDTYPDKWSGLASAFRAQVACEIDLPYGETLRQRFDLFHPDRLARGLVIFVHGGYWLRFDKSYWSHLAAGPLAQGWAVAMPSYDLCPDVRIDAIGRQIDKAIATMAARVAGPIRLVGHSAGGQLAALSVTRRSRWLDRVDRVVPVSPVADLTPLMQTRMNADLQIDAALAATQSPARLPPPSVPVTVWVGGAERPVFGEQARQLADAWKCRVVSVPDQHHFSVIEDLAIPDSALTQAVLA